MKVFTILFVLLSVTCYGLNARCVGNSDESLESCKVRTFPEPDPTKIHYIYQGENCDCPRRHILDVRVEKPAAEEKVQKYSSYQYGIEKTQTKKAEDEVRYLFDVHIEKPTEKPATELKSYNYELHLTPTKVESDSSKPRYVFDTRIEKMIKPCEEKPWQGLVSQVDRILVPGCKNPQHTPQTCNCQSCNNPSHTPRTCNCNKNSYQPMIPMIFSAFDNDAINVRIKRNAAENDKLGLGKIFSRSNRKSKKINSDMLKLDSIKQEKIAKDLIEAIKKPKKLPKKTDVKDIAELLKSTSNKPKKLKPKSDDIVELLKLQPRSKRRPQSQCAFNYQTCDVKHKTSGGCPLCYNCKCEPVDQIENQKFSPRDIKIPYRMSPQGEHFSAPMYQEFDDESPSYTGLKNQDFYKNYIEQIISKYPDHMASRMPDLKDQQRDLMRFIGDLTQNYKPQSGLVENEDVRYKLLDNAADLYKLYENAMKGGKRSLGNGKFLNKRGTVLEIVEISPNEYGVKSAAEDFGENFSDDAIST